MSPTTSPALRARWLAAATVLLALIFAGVYVEVVRSQGDSGIAWWYLTLVLIAAALSCFATATGRVRQVMPVCAFLLGGCALVGLLSVGILLVPAVVTAVLSVVVAGPRNARGAQ